MKTPPKRFATVGHHNESNTPDMTESSNSQFEPLLHIELKSTLNVDRLDDPVQQTVEHSFRVYFFNGDDEQTDVGYGELVEIPAHYDVDDDDQESNYEAMDAQSSETCELHEAIQAHLDAFPEGGVWNPVYLEKLIIKPDFQGRGLGTQVLQRLMHHWSRHAGNPSHLFLLAFPIDPDADEDREEWQRRDPEGFQLAKARVRRFYERLGFEPLGRTDFMAFDLQRAVPEIATV